MSTLDDLLSDLISGDEVRAEAAVPSLTAMGVDAFPALRGLLASDEADHRWWAVRTLAQSPQARAEWLLPFLEDNSPEVRQAAALGLSSHPDETAVGPLVQALSDPDTLVSTLACNALVAIGNPAVPELTNLPADTPQRARINATRALAEIADPGAIPALMAAVEDESVMIQYWAEEGLTRLGLDMVYLKPD